MRPGWMIAACAGLACGALPFAALAQAEPVVAAAAPAEQQTDPHEALMTAIFGGIDRETILARLSSQMRDAMLMSSPDMQTLEKLSPGTASQIVQAIQPVLARHVERTQAQGKTEIVALLRNRLSPEDARGAADFYGSPQGQKVMRLVSSNINRTGTMREAMAGKGETDVSEETLTRDNAATTAGAIRELGTAELMEIGKAVIGQPWLPRLQALMPEIVAINARLENAPMAPEDEQAIEKAVVQVIEKRFGKGD